jgi:hypothetical protein
MTDLDKRLIKKYESDLKYDTEKRRQLLEQLKEVDEDIKLKRFYCRELKGKEVS